MLYQTVESKAELFRCIGDPTCLKLLSLLMENKKLCVSEITVELAVSMPAVSHQLRKLRSLGILDRKREGQMICYFFADTDEAKQVKRILREVL